MTQAQQRIAIAEAVGWIQIRLEDELDPNKERSIYLAGKMQGWAYSAEIPDFPNDLNAMNEAEKVFDVNVTDRNSKRYAYCNNLYSLVPLDQQPFRATAAQRAEAFLRTIGKWVD